MNKKFLVVLIILLAIVLGVVLGLLQVKHSRDKENTEIQIDNPPVSENENENEKNDTQETEDPIVTKKETKVRAVYLTGWSAGTKSKRESTITNLKENGFNGVVIDIKDEAGRLSYDSEVQDAVDIKASQKMISNVRDVIQEFHDNDIYVIGRIVTFKDPLYAKSKTEVAYQYADGTLWKDYSGNNWPNPYNTKYWEYPIALAEEAAELGFDEIQFDYIRFPSSEGKVKQIAFGFDSDTKTKADVIAGFLSKVMEEMEPYHVVISADVFGITTKRAGDFENIGQDFARIAKIVDVICPMVYPSHYAYNEYKIPKPDKDPYHTVYGALKDAKARIEEAIPSTEHSAMIRPYLQDFTASWLGSGNYLTYGTAEVQSQIQACFDLRIDELILWDPSNKYCYDALQQATWLSDEEYEAKLLEEQQKMEQEQVNTESNEGVE
ncbi:MAG: putative glycoside hydrolase [Clostridia bacterium]|nr:putative glycoside hydrolase [Clostridia bacterium]